MPNEHAQALGSLGGKARAQKLSPERRKEIAKIASLKATEARKNKMKISNGNHCKKCMPTKDYPFQCPFGECSCHSKRK